MPICTIKGGQRAPAYVRIYEELISGERGVVKFNNLIQRDEIQSIETTTGLIRYEYKYNINDNWQEDIGAACSGIIDVIVP